MASKKPNKIPFHKKILCQMVIFTFSIITLTGCAVAPKKLFIKDISKSFEEGSIISAKTGTLVQFDALVADLKDVRIVFVGENTQIRLTMKFSLG